MKKESLFRIFASIAFLAVFTVGYSAVDLWDGSSKKIVVDKSGAEDYISIQEAINSLPDSSLQPTIIYIKKGIYREKILIKKCNIIFEGEDRDKTIITQSIARDEWRCDHADDWGVATINIDGSDITLKNLTIVNSYGYDHIESRVVTCASDSVARRKTIPPNGHQMALRTMRGTRIKAVNVHFKAFAGDTVSPWNVERGMFYFKDCTMEGGVDFYCPRGWAYAENCRFYANTGPASIWHDGSMYKDEKTVFVNCFFDGYNGFNLGRYHKDAQFYLINCNFSRSMANKDIYLVATNNIIKWGRRIYFFDCHRQGGDYSWFKNNLADAPGAPDANRINANWVFKEQWNPL